MAQKLYKDCVSDLLWSTMQRLSGCNLLDGFRLVGGTSLSLQLGHRQSDDIDLFTDLPYGSVDLKSVIRWLKSEFDYVGDIDMNNIGPGISCFIGESESQCIKLDIYYTDSFIRSPGRVGKLLFAGLEDVSAMKLDMISRGGRKKDFWDIHELLDRFSLTELINFYEERYPYSDCNEVLKGLTDFRLADEMEDPRCYKGKIWELIKLDIEENGTTVRRYDGTMVRWYDGTTV